MIPSRLTSATILQLVPQALYIAITPNVVSAKVVDFQALVGYRFENLIPFVTKMHTQI